MTITTVADDRLPQELYLAEQVRELDRTAIEDLGIPGITLMERAGAAAFRLLRWRWSRAREITILCGGGNNGGDGYVVARLALEAGLKVHLLQLGDAAKLHGDAKTAADAFVAAGGVVSPYTQLPQGTDLIVDAVLGTGLERDVTGVWAEALAAAHADPAPILAIDIPSGLHADNGRLLGVAAEAAATISFIGLKQGLFTGQGPALTGRIYFDDLDVPAEVYVKQQPAAHRIDWRQQSALLKPRSRISHKGEYGHLLVVGGDHGYSGAVRMAAEAAARSGAGLVSVATRQEHAALINMGRPELMCHAIDVPADLRQLLAKVDTVAIGPGLGQSAWGTALFSAVLESGLPLVVDADALNLLAAEPSSRESWVLTPHPGEAARLLGCNSAEVQADRLGSADRLQQKYGGVVVLKGAGSVIQSGLTLPPSIATEGNPGMASGGMGDLLTGIIAGLWAQGFSAGEAARMGVCLHAAAADKAAADGGERGLLAGDLLPWIRPLLNPMRVSA